MSIEPFEITTVYPDGTSETRWSTAEEIAQREADLAQFEADRVAREEAEAAAAAKKASAMAKLAALGLDDDEIAAIIR
jgi:hypothetical protein